MLGGEVSQSLPWILAGREVVTRIGLQARHDDIRLALTRTVARPPLSTVREDRVRQDSLGVFTDSTWRLGDWLRLSGGLRADWVGGRVRSDAAENSGAAGEWIASPKAGLVLGPWAATELFLNAGSGFHSNDLRGATIRVDPTDRLAPP